MSTKKRALHTIENEGMPFNSYIWQEEIAEDIDPDMPPKRTKNEIDNYALDGNESDAHKSDSDDDDMPPLGNRYQSDNDSDDSASKDDDEESEEEDDARHILQSGVTSWQKARRKYTAEIKVRRHYEYEEIREVNAILLFDNKPIGHLSGTILPRPNRNFYELGDAISGELQWLTSLFCEDHGAATRISTNLEGNGTHSGGFFHINEVVIEKAYKGNDLGLRLVHETLVFLLGEWKLVVLKSGVLTSALEDRLGITARNLNSNEVEDLNTMQEQKANIQNVIMKLDRHWARMGFQQAGRNVDECEAWYMTSLTYFGGQESSTSPSMAMKRWKSKEEIQRLDIFVAPEEHVPQGADKELRILVDQEKCTSLSEEEQLNVLRRINYLVTNQNASIHGSRVLFWLAVNATVDDNANTILFKCLLMLNPNDANAPDENGNRPLHVAASTMNSVGIRLLIEAGANLSLKNVKGCTPINCLEKRREDIADFRQTFSLQIVRPIDVTPFVESMHLLMANDVRGQLVDGWLSPRMMKMFEITAGNAYEMIIDSDISSIQFKKFKPTPLKEFCHQFGGFQFFNMQHFEYIPPEVFLRNPEGLYKSFCDGWGIVWEAINSLLHKKQAPTLSRVEQEIYRIQADHRKWEHFKQKGGRIEYALDALLCVTQNVHNGDGHWETCDFEDEINALSATPLDGDFDVVRVKCLQINEDNFRLQPKGPYNHNIDLCSSETEDY